MKRIRKIIIIFTAVLLFSCGVSAQQLVLLPGKAVYREGDRVRVGIGISDTSGVIEKFAGYRFTVEWDTTALKSQTATWTYTGGTMGDDRINHYSYVSEQPFGRENKRRINIAPLGPDGLPFRQGIHMWVEMETKKLTRDSTWITFKVNESSRFDDRFYTEPLDSASVRVLITKPVVREDLFPTYAQLWVYPNPTTSQLTIGNPAAGRLQICDGLGKIVSEISVTDPQHTFSVEELTPGIYQLIFTDRYGKVSSARVAKN